MDKSDLLNEASRRGIFVERFPILTTEIILKILNIMSDEEIYFWSVVQKKDKLISYTIKQFTSEMYQFRILKVTQLDIDSYDYYRNELLIKMVEIDLNSGLENETNIIL
ncbi:hypothetical protein [Cytobacillus oceanisediminis]|uniref:Uncharacterized protein n=1 Tax=Cytobacillus oceanisediminis 2691 TaxID=1196031 RepID=A0A161JUP2_9BACI|nr:hypothetical protein [Cytobacillus oceanisediminis]AND41491.1 hypothetical protein A361_20770 [Cytobacillus oceanisediminis 2691]